ncbi:multi-sensor signal transduction histidine kinase [Chthoniobacter flavus Ellin428]|uniref:histidine kinase n=1 Tax=Chthoniobacter flavus Ellin428 TaxID=497964 RepID=B4D6U9_9BACT|nr:PAS domain S-box protein [Chthoniobacter flavus]EDY17900.1 multi-sensor signal transduction histidine kinase [Chthoniobacter flavus Ellin428]TCO88508.1 PAS domain S-box-containing protein [Chthoniobacter flavus]
MNILLVDDIGTNRKLLRVVLEAAGHTAIEAADGVEALTVLERKSVDLVISDILMPRMDGYRLCWEVRRDERLRHLPFIVHSATYTSPSDASLALELGADSFLPKPVSARELLEAIDQAANSTRRQPTTALSETEVLREYSERLVTKLEEKNTEVASAAMALRESETLLRMIIDSQPECVKLLAADGSLLKTNPAGLRMLEADSFQEVENRSVYPIVAEEYRPAFRELNERVFAGGSGTLEFEIVGLKGGRRWLATYACPLRNASGQIFALLGITHDITARKRAEEAQVRLAAIVNSSDDAIIGKTLNGIITTWNPGAERMFGYCAEEIVGKSMLTLIPPDRVHEEKEILSRIGAAESVVHFETVRIRKDGSCVDISATISPINDSAGKIVGASQIARDITEQKRALEQLRNSHAQLRELTGRLHAAREEERGRISREIHDVLAQQLTRLKMDLSWIDKRLAQSVDETTRQALGEKVRSATELVDSSIGAVQHIATELRPVVLDALGLAAAVEWQVTQFQEHTGVQCQVDIDGEEPRLPHDHATGLFRILQETLTNVMRHAGATLVEVSLRMEPDILTLSVRDNGRGITAGELSNMHSIGLLGMRERALLFGGKVTIHGIPEKGTTVVVTMPLSAASQT